MQDNEAEFHLVDICFPVCVGFANPVWQQSNVNQYVSTQLPNQKHNLLDYDLP